MAYIIETKPRGYTTIILMMVGHEIVGVFNLLWISEQLTGQPVMFLGALNMFL